MGSAGIELQLCLVKGVGGMITGAFTTFSMPVAAANSRRCIHEGPNITRACECFLLFFHMGNFLCRDNLTKREGHRGIFI